MAMQPDGISSAEFLRLMRALSVVFQEVVYTPCALRKACFLWTGVIPPRAV